jgi:predicted O-linked N-acetylglucosamine transferase (SPINDLY family)
VRRLLDAATGNAVGDISPRPLRSGRRRIGLVSSCLHQHSVTRAWGEALLALPADEFDLHVFHTSARDDVMVQRFRARAGRYIGGAHSFAAWTQWLREAELDVLVFLDLGLDVVNQCLAALRHAPVQVSTWAHPVTSGAATIDWFVSAQASEPAHAAAHYSESLHRLPRLGGCFLEPPHPPLPRRARDGRTRLVCAQNLYKLHPRHDALFGRILARAPDTTLDFLTAATPEQAAGFERRLAPVLRDFDIDPARVRVHSTLTGEAYRRRIADADLLLDTLGFSGGITTLDALWQERAWLTLPGECMRGRQSSAMLLQLGLEPLVASSEADYVERAVALADSPEQLRELAREIAERKHALFRDTEVCSAFADFLRDVRATALPD